jgi:hypothetical protein
MTPWEIKLLNGEVSFFHRLDSFIDRHPLLMTLAVIYLLLALLAWVIVSTARRRAKGLIPPCSHVIYIPPSTPPPAPEEPPLDMFPSKQELEDECERLSDSDYREY